MQKIWQLFSLRTKLFLIFFSLCAVTTSILAVSLYKQIRTDYYELLQHQLVIMASISSSQLNGDKLESLTSTDQEDSDDYLNTRQLLTRINKTSDHIKFVYTLRKSATPGKLEFIVDDDPDPDSAAHIGDLYDAALAPAMLKAFSGASADTEPIEDKWGSTMSGYAPIYNSQGQVVAIIGVDMGIDTILAELEEFKQHTLNYAIICLLIAAGASYLLANVFTSRLKRLKCAVDELASGNLNIDVSVEGNDEMARLAARINNLAITLNSEREQTLLATIEGLVNALEAKDSYTYGHSSEVATLVSDICQALTLPETEAFSISFAAILHDIGKIGVPDKVLNKEGPLTDVEWVLVKQHPATGSRIISGIPSLENIAKTVLHHHARWDGKGYPSSLAGDDIPLGSRIIAVADSFQAMTSDRSYRRGMPVDTALAEIKRCSGTQFDPAIVEIFVQIINTKIH